MADRPGALSGVTVVDVTSDVSGAYAGKLLADLGADVVLVEPAEGSALRCRPPLAPGHGGSGVLFDHLAGGKRSVVPPADAPRFLADLVWSADVVLVDGTSPFGAQLPTARPEHLVELDLSPFGRSGPYAGWRGSDIGTWALGGYLYFTGTPAGGPLWLPGSQAQLHAGAHGAFAVLAALYERGASGRGQRVEVSDLEATLAAHAWLVSSWAACGQALRRVENDLVRTVDGWVYVMQIVPAPDLFVLIDRPDLAEENLADDLTTWFANVPRIFQAVAEWAKDKTVEEIVEFGQALRLAVTPVLDARDVADDPQLAARDWWERDEADGMRFPGQPFHLSLTPSYRRGRSPRVGEHTEVVRAAVGSGVRPDPPAGLALGGGALEGLRVVEVTNNWAGPVCGRHLGDLGADVVKVEWATKPATRALFWVGPTQDQQRQGHHRSMYFNEMNRNKRDVVIDLSHAAGREAFLDLVRDADVLIENNSARVMPNLGLDWDVLHEVNPRLIMVSMSGYGASGPRRDWVAYGANIETTSGLTSITGYPGGQTSRTSLFYADPVSGILGTVAVMAALEHRRHSGEGQWIEIALNECGVSFCTEMLVDFLATGTVRRPAGNRDPRFAPQGVYRCAGADNWVAVVVQNDDDWPVLADAIGRADLAADPELATLAGRQARHDEMDDAISAWTAGLEQYEAAWALQRLGISAAPVLANWQILPDPHIAHRQFYVPVEHPVVGVYPTTSWPWRFSRTPGSVRRPAPLFGQHNREILHEAGLDEDRIADLYRNGVTSDHPA